MFSRIGNRKVILSTLLMVLLIWGVQGVSYVEAAPDLVVGTPGVSRNSVAVGDKFTLSVRVTNTGTTASPAATVIYYRSRNRNITPNDELVGNEAVLPLDANGGYTDSSITLTAQSPAGPYYYGAYVTPVTDEMNLANNITSTGTPLTITESAVLSVSVPRSLSDLRSPLSNFQPPGYRQQTLGRQQPVI